MDFEVTVKIKNLDRCAEEYIVAKPDEGELWFWGSYKSKKIAEEVAKNVGGVVAERRRA